MATLFADGGLDVDHWQIDVPTLTAVPEFRGMEVDRRLAGIPTVHYGPGDAKPAHGPLEPVPISQISPPPEHLPR